MIKREDFNLTPQSSSLWPKASRTEDGLTWNVGLLPDVEKRPPAHADSNCMKVMALIETVHWFAPMP